MAASARPLFASVRTWAAASILAAHYAVLLLGRYNLDPASLVFFPLAVVGLSVRFCWARFLAICLCANVLVANTVGGNSSPWLAGCAAVIALLFGRRVRALFEDAPSRFNIWPGRPHADKLRALILTQCLALGIVYVVLAHNGFGDESWYANEELSILLGLISATVLALWFHRWLGPWLALVTAFMEGWVLAEQPHGLGLGVWVGGGLGLTALWLANAGRSPKPKTPDAAPIGDELKTWRPRVDWRSVMPVIVAVGGTTMALFECLTDTEGPGAFLVGVILVVYCYSAIVAPAVILGLVPLAAIYVAFKRIAHRPRVRADEGGFRIQVGGEFEYIPFSSLAYCAVLGRGEVETWGSPWPGAPPLREDPRWLVAHGNGRYLLFINRQGQEQRAIALGQGRPRLAREVLDACERRAGERCRKTRLPTCLARSGDLLDRWLARVLGQSSFRSPSPYRAVGLDALELQALLDDPWVDVEARAAAAFILLRSSSLGGAPTVTGCSPPLVLAAAYLAEPASTPWTLVAAALPYLAEDDQAVIGKIRACNGPRRPVA